MNSEYNSNYQLNKGNLQSINFNDSSTVNSNNFFANKAISVSHSNTTFKDLRMNKDKINELYYKDGNNNNIDNIDMKKITEIDEHD